MVDRNTAVSFLSMFRTRNEIRKEFDMSNSESWHYLTWHIKVNDIEVQDVTGVGMRQKGIIKLYRWKNETCNNDTQ